MTPSLQHFETFLTVAKAGSFTKAAIALHVSKASVSQTIRLLEQSYQVTLFKRSTRHVCLTDEGELLYTQCLRLKHELDTTREVIDGFNTSPTGTLRISCNLDFAESKLLKIIQQYQVRCPQVKIEVIAEERMPDIQQEQIDIVFGINWPAPLDVVAKVIGQTRYVLCAAPSYLEEFGTPQNISDLEQHQYIPHYGRPPNQAVISLKKNIRLNINSKLISNSASFMKQCALQGFGMIQLHDYMVADELQQGALIEILPELFEKSVPVYIYYQKHQFVQPKIRQFVNLCTS
tara:strand:+ start:3383 stop:4252 length:870 start_codon:yes stop_codon:yes gene_type:complete